MYITSSRRTVQLGYTQGEYPGGPCGSGGPCLLETSTMAPRSRLAFSCMNRPPCPCGIVHLAVVESSTLPWWNRQPCPGGIVHLWWNRPPLVESSTSGGIVHLALMELSTSGESSTLPWWNRQPCPGGIVHLPLVESSTCPGEIVHFPLVESSTFP